MIEDKKNLFRVILIAVLLVAAAAAIRSARDGKTDSGQFGGISILVNEKPTTPDATFFGAGKTVPATPTSQSRKAPETPADPLRLLTARAYLIGNVATGKILAEKNADKKMPVASMSKLITAIVATDTMASTTVIEITAVEASTSPDASGIGAGEKFVLNEMLYPLLLDSSNIAAEAIASSSDRGKFLELMSGYAWEVGAPQANFADPTGLSPLNMATARGIFAIAEYLYKSRSDILELTRVPESSVATTSDHGSHVFKSTHPFVSDPRFIGGKTGRTPEAGETMLTILKINNEPIAFVVMGSAYGAREGDTRLLISVLEGGFAQR